MSLSQVPRPSLGEAVFPSTAWSAIINAQSEGAREREGLARLMSIYWRPLYWTFRLDWRASPEEAQDLTQSYIAMFLERRMVLDLTPHEGRFRSYVKKTIKHFVLNWRRDNDRMKRGGSNRTIPLNDVSQESIERLENTYPRHSQSPDRLFEQELMRSILKSARDALREACQHEGRDRWYELFSVYYLEEPESHYEDLGRRFDLSHHEIKNRLASLRTRYRNLVLGHVRDGVASEDELMGEIREIFSP